MSRARIRIQLGPRGRHNINHGAAQNIISGDLDKFSCCDNERVSSLVEIDEAATFVVLSGTVDQTTTIPHQRKSRFMRNVIRITK